MVAAGGAALSIPSTWLTESAAETPMSEDWRLLTAVFFLKRKAASGGSAGNGLSPCRRVPDAKTRLGSDREAAKGGAGNTEAAVEAVAAEVAEGRGVGRLRNGGDSGREARKRVERAGETLLCRSDPFPTLAPPSLGTSGLAFGLLSLEAEGLRPVSHRRR
jgi:hypothetical protein